MSRVHTPRFIWAEGGDIPGQVVQDEENTDKVIWYVKPQLQETPNKVTDIML